MPVLTQEQSDHFLERGFVVIHDCFPRELAEKHAEDVFTRMGYDRSDPDTWTVKWVPMPIHEYYDIAGGAPKAWEAICEIIGGEERILTPHRWSDGFIANFGVGADREWESPSPKVRGWHIDGDFFRHFLDSPEQGLLTLVLWSDIAPKGGGTFVAADSVGVVSRFLARHPEGVRPTDIPFHELVAQCGEFVECIGRIGDVVLLHPFILHAVSQNHSGRLRLILNPPVQLKEPMRFDRLDGNYSLVEKAVLEGLGVESYPFAPAAPRERIVPERERIQEEARRMEKERLAAAQIQRLP